MAIFQTFFKEGGIWKVSNPQMVGFIKGKLPQPPLTLDSTVPAAPALLKSRPDDMAYYSVNAYSYQVRLTVDGREIEAVSGGKSEAGVLIGGLRRGENVISATYRREAGAPPSRVEIVFLARRSIEDQEQRIEILRETKESQGKVRRIIKLP